MSNKFYMHTSIFQKNNFGTSIKQLVKCSLFLLVTLFISTEGFCQPANDNPCNAIAITAGTTCTYTQGTNVDATATTGVPAPGCASYSGNDVWFKVVVPAGGAIIFDSEEGTMDDGGMAIYRGTCTGLTVVGCDDDSGPGAMPRVTVSAQTPGDTLWVRFWDYGNDGNGTFGVCARIPPPPPANDDPCNATVITALSTCTYQTFTNENATGSTGIPAPGCASYSGGDVWFQVTVPAGGALIFDSQTGAMLDGGMAIYSGTCTALTLISCNDDASANGLMPMITANGLTPGSTVWVRFWEYSNDNNGTFGLCVRIPPPPPANDNPCLATLIPVSATCTYQTFTNESATASPGVPAPGCAGYTNADVWFSAIVPAGGAITFDTQEGQMVDGGMAVYRGTCGALVRLACDDDASQNGAMPKITVNGLNPGDTLWVRMWSNGNDNNGTFGICATIPPPPPANDNPCNAVLLTANQTCTYATFTNESATATTGVPAPGCANYQGGDVWFKVVVPSTGGLQFDTQTGVVLDAGMAIYSGTCTALTLISCDDDASANGAMPLITGLGLTPGDTIWVRVWERGNDNNGTFGICVRALPPPPVNDNPCQAIQLNSSPVCNFLTFSNESATNTTGVPAPGCANYTGGDVWFKVIVPSSGSLQMTTSAGVIVDGGMAIYRGSCTALTLVSCNDDASTTNDMPQISVRGQNPGDTLWIRVWDRGNDNNGTFGICVTTLPPPGPGDICTLANPFCSSNTYLFPNNTNQPSLGGNGIYDCLVTTPNPVWYYMQVQNPGGITLGIQQRTCPGPNGEPGELIDVDFALWGPFPSLAAGCGGLTANNNISCSYSTAGTETAVVPNAQAGQVYILLITNYSNEQGLISFSQTGGTGNTGSTNCSIVNTCNLAAYNSGPVCTGDSLYLSATNLPCASYSWTGPNGFTSTDKNPRLVAPPFPGIYTYTVTGVVPGVDLTCVDTTNVYVGEKPELGPDTTINKCAVEPVNLDILYSTNGLPFAWYFGGAVITNTSAVTASGVYTLVVTNEIGCADSAKVTLNAEPAPVLGNDTTVLVCGGVSANLTSIFNTGTLTTQWTFGGAPVPDPTSVTTNGVYQLIAINIAGCADTVLVTLGTGPKPAIGNDTTIVFCAGSSVNLTTIYTTTTGLTMQWSFGGIALADATAVTIDGVYQGIGTNASGCSDTVLVTLTLAPKPALGADASAFFCPGFSTDLTTFYTTTGLTASWTLAGAPVAQPSAVTVAGIYQLIVTNTNGCTDTASVTVRANTLAATVTAVDASCGVPAGVITVTPVNGTSPFEYSINNGVTYVSNNIFNPAASQTAYSVIVRDADGCKDTVSATISFTNDLTLQSRTDTTICGNESVQMSTVSNATSFSWTPSTGLSSTSIASPVASPTATTVYVVTATTGPCSAKDTVTITVFPLPTVNAGADITVIRGDDAQLFSIINNANGILWTPSTYLNNVNIANPVAVRPDQTIQYRVTASNAVGCSSFDDVLVTVLPYCVKVKNAFTPNGDGVNDNWMVYDDFNCLKNIRVQVFNRYGSKVYESSNYRNNWTGTYNGKSLPDATYYYVIDYTLITNKVVQLRGDVTILR